MFMKKQIRTEKETDTEFLARLMADGFVRVGNQINGLATKEELREFRDETNDRFRRLENILYRGHDNRIEKLEDKIAQIQVILGKKLA